MRAGVSEKANTHTMTQRAHDSNRDAPGADLSADPRPVFVEMFQAVRRYLLGEGRSDEATARIAVNPKGEATRRFDAEAERIALDVARHGLGAFRAFSEEAGEIVVGEDPRWTLVIDPCDGSNNFRRGIRSVGFAVAALPAGAPLDPDRVEYAVCGDIFTGALYSAARGHGATVDGEPCAASRLTEPRYAVLGVNLGRERSARAIAPGEPAGPDALWGLVRTVSTVRRTGATVLDLCYVAQGACDAYVDLRRRLTPENFLAPALIIREAGGLFGGADGRPLGPVEFTTPYSVIAAGTPELLDAILRLVG